MSYDFGGTNDSFAGDFGEGNELGYPITIAMWMKFPDHPAAQQTPVNFGVNDNTVNSSHRMLIGVGDSDNTFFANSVAFGGGSASSNETQTDVDDRWFPVIAVFRSDASRQIYVDGTAGTHDTNSRVVAETLRYLRIGENLQGGDEFQFNLAEVAIWNSDLSLANMDLYEAGTSGDQIDSANLVGYWSFSADDLSPDDESGNGGPTLSAVGTPTFDADHPVITGGSENTTITVPTGPHR